MDHTHSLFDDPDSIGQHCLVRIRRKAKKRNRAQRRIQRQKEMKFRRWLDERKNKFNIRLRDSSQTGNRDMWLPADVRKMHVGLLDTSMTQLASVLPGTALFLDLAAWFEDEAVRPFSFAACCALIGVDSSEQRMAAKATFMAACVENLALGKSKVNAVNTWLQGDPAEPMSFAGCCEATGYSQEQVLKRFAA